MRNVIVAVALLTLVACASVKTDAGKMLATTAATVDASMKGWGVWVALGKSTSAQETAVENAYAKYQASMMVATNAYATLVLTGNASVWNVASAVVQSNQVALTSQIRTFQTIK